MTIVRCGKQGLAVDPTERKYPGEEPRQQKKETATSIRNIEKLMPSVKM
jgi:hypothetical protein